MNGNINLNENTEVLSSDEEMKKIHENFERTKEKGVKGILKYFDRIHDKLFNFNNILIVGYFALSKVYDKISLFSVFIPLCNLMVLIYIEYRMMEKSRFESNIMDQTSSTINKYGKRISNTNLFSLLSIISTVSVTILFLYYFFKE